jgi:adenine-specific DNA methylase
LVDLIVTDPPFFDNVHYSELADFFHAWQQLGNTQIPTSTRHPDEVQDRNASSFADKLGAIFKECHRLLKENGLLVFSYHHSRVEGWQALADAVLGSGFAFVNSHPVRGELSVAAPKSQAKEPIQLDIILVCRKRQPGWQPCDVDEALKVAEMKIQRLLRAGFRLSRNDCKIIVLGQVLTTLSNASDFEACSAAIASLVDRSSAFGLHHDDKTNRQEPVGLLPLFEGLSNGD